MPTSTVRNEGTGLIGINAVRDVTLGRESKHGQCNIVKQNRTELTLNQKYLVVYACFMPLCRIFAMPISLRPWRTLAIPRSRD